MAKKLSQQCVLAAWKANCTLGCINRGVAAEEGEGGTVPSALCMVVPAVIGADSRGAMAVLKEIEMFLFQGLPDWQSSGREGIPQLFPFCSLKERNSPF